MLPTSGNYGYRAITTRLATEYQIKVPRDLVYDVLTDLDHEGMAAYVDTVDLVSIYELIFGAGKGLES